MAYGYNWRTDQQVTSTSTANVQTVTPPAGARAALVSVETTSARVTFAGGAPSATLGHVIPVAQPPVLILTGDVFKFASTAGTSSVMNITWGF